MINTIASYLFYAYFFISSYICLSLISLVCLCTSWFDKRRHIVNYLVCIWAHHYVQIVPSWKCRIEGRENVDPQKPYVYVSNHQSFSDINVLYGIYRPFKWISKQELFSVPILGWNLKLNECVPLKRGDRKSIKEMMQACSQRLQAGASLMIFPEGTRSEDGEIHEFREGAFRLSIDNKIPIVPVVLDGTGNIITKSGRTMNFKSNIHVKVLPAIDPQPFGDNIGAYREHVRDLMIATLNEMRGHKVDSCVGAATL